MEYKCFVDFLWLGIVVLTPLLSSCEKPRACNCPVEDFYAEQEEMFTSQDGWEIDAATEFKMGAKIREMVNVEIAAHPGLRNYDISASKIVTRIKNEFPQYTSETYEFKMGRLFYCAYYLTLCQDANLPDSTLRILSQLKLTDFESTFRKFQVETQESSREDKKVQPLVADPAAKSSKIVSTFSGTVRDGLSGDPLRDVTFVYDGSKVGRSGPNGYYRFSLEVTDVAARKIIVYVQKRGYEPEILPLLKEGQTQNFSIYQIK